MFFCVIIEIKRLTLPLFCTAEEIGWRGDEISFKYKNKNIVKNKKYVKV